MYNVTIRSKSSENDYTQVLYPQLCEGCLVKMKCLQWGYYEYQPLLDDMDNPATIFVKNELLIFSHRACGKLVYQLKQLPYEIREKISVTAYSAS